MARIYSTTFVSRSVVPGQPDYEYRLALDLREQPIADGVLEMAVVAERRIVGDGFPGPGPWEKVEAKIALNVVERRLTVTVAGQPVGTIRLPPVADWIPDALPLEDAWQEILDNSEGLVNLLNFIPAGDPIIGCILKAGITTLTGQAVRCIHATRRRDLSPFRRARAVLQCLGEHAGDMLWTATKRFFRCAITLGFM